MRLAAIPSLETRLTMRLLTRWRRMHWLRRPLAGLRLYIGCHANHSSVRGKWPWLCSVLPYWPGGCYSADTVHIPQYFCYMLIDDSREHYKQSDPPCGRLPPILLLPTSEEAAINEADLPPCDLLLQRESCDYICLISESYIINQRRRKWEAVMARKPM